MQSSRRCDYFVVRTRSGSYLYCPFKKNPSSLMLCMKKVVSLLYNFSLCVAPAPKEIVLASQELRENVKYNLTGGEVVYVSLPCPPSLLPAPPLSSLPLPPSHTPRVLLSTAVKEVGIRFHPSKPPRSRGTEMQYLMTCKT